MPDDWVGHPLRKDYPLRGPARERTPRPPFALKSNVPAGTPPSGKVAAALQRQIGARAARRTRSERSPARRRHRLRRRQARRQHDDAVDGAAAPVDARRAPGHRRGQRRDDRARRDGDRLPTHRHREVGRKPLLDAGLDRHRAHGLPLPALQRALLHPRASNSCSASPTASPSARSNYASCSCELTRIASHCVWLGTHAIDIGAITNFWYAFDIRENILDLIEASGGARMHPNYLRIGGLNGDIPDGFLAKLDALIEKFPGRMRDLRRDARRTTRSGATARSTSASSRPKKPSAGASPAPSCAPAASPTTSARPSRTAATRTTTSTSRPAPKATPTRVSSSASTRWTKRCASSTQVRKALEPGPVMIDDPKLAAPPKETIALSMEALIHHFKIVSESFRVPPGDVYQAVESPRGELGYYLVSDGNQSPVSHPHASPLDVQPASAQEHRVGNLIADVVVMIGSLDPVFGEVDR